MTKYGVEAFSDALRREMQPWGIKVSMLEPGSFLTNICAPNVFEQQLRQAWNMLSDELKNEYGEEYLNAGIDLFWGTKKKLLAVDLNPLTSCQVGKIHNKTKTIWSHSQNAQCSAW